VHRAYHPSPTPDKRRIRWWALLPWLAVAYAATGFYAVQPNEVAVVRRCGRLLPERRKPGLHFGFPYGIDRVDRLKILERKRVAVGTSLAERDLGRRVEPQQSECLTGDRNLILVAAIVQYQIERPEDYLVNVAGVPEVVRNAAGSALAGVVASMKVDDVLTVERIAIQNEVRRATQAAVDRYGAGVRVTSISLEGVTPPQEVAEAFRDVTSAREDRQRAVSEAQGYANRTLPQARGEAHQIRLEAEGYADEVVQKASGDVDRFGQMQAQLSPGNRRLTEKRLILETMERVLPRLNKVVVDSGTGDALDLGLIEADE